MMGTPDGPLWHTPWRERAACANTDPKIWWEAKHQTLAVGICLDCPVSRQCLDDALRYPKTSDPVGIRGGLTPQERDVIRRERRRGEAA